MDDLYYDGAHDALVEAVQEVKAAMVMGYPDLKRADHRTDTEFWTAVVVRALEDLRESYAKDAKFVAAIRKAKP